jgi:uroporphyrinogen decarboxylase
LPQYRALRNSLTGFRELVTRPELAAEATLQPVDELDVDAAILFSDILVIPEAMGLAYEMEEKKGPSFPKTIQHRTDIEALASGSEAAGRLGYVYESLRLTKKALNGRVPLLGFAGAPWTLLAYMVEGGGSKTFSKAKKFLYTQPALAHLVLDKITETVIAYLNEKIKAGADAVQLFDSWAGILSPALYAEFSLPYLNRICRGVKCAPIIIFPKDGWFALPEIGELDCAAVGLDWTVTPKLGRQWVGKKVLQGNLDPCCLYAEKEFIQKATVQMLHEFAGRHIANLGHGVYPDTPLDGVKWFVDTVKSFSYETDAMQELEKEIL